MAASCVLREALKFSGRWRGPVFGVLSASREGLSLERGCERSVMRVFGSAQAVVKVGKGKSQPPSGIHATRAGYRAIPASR